MNTRNYHTDKDELFEHGMRILKSSQESKYHFRTTVVLLVLSGYSVEELAAHFGYSSVAISGWVKTADEQGFAALYGKKIPGRPKKLTEEQFTQIQSALQSDPQDSGYPVWDGNTLSEYIENRFSVNLSVRSCQRILRDLLEI